MLSIDLQWAIKEQSCPTLDQCKKWVTAALIGEQRLIETELSIRIVDKEESQTLNKDFRGIDKPTNVLSFPFENPPGLADLGEVLPYIGDLVICTDIVLKEAQEQGKTIEEHWAHMIIHGTLHLQGYDHIEEQEANEMESLEIEILESFGFQNPYQTNNGVS